MHWPQFEADRRAFIITINSFGTELTKEDRAKLFPHCGRLYPEGLAQLARADDYEQVKNVADYYPVSVLAMGRWVGILVPAYPAHTQQCPHAHASHHCPAPGV